MESSQTDTQGSFDPTAVRIVLCDLDGVVWLARTAIAGAADAVARLRMSGRRVLFVTNNSMSRVNEQEEALGSIGIPAVGDVVTSAQSAAALVDAGERVLVCGGVGVTEAVGARGATVVSSGPADAVVVGLHRHFDYAGLEEASRSVRGGAHFIATNDDATYPTPAGPIPGGGALVAAVATASGRQPTIAGKPHAPMADLVRRRCGQHDLSASALMVGDRWSTDGAFATTLGCPFALVRTGVTPNGAAPGGPVDLDAADLVEVTEIIIGS